jgi:uncharacterized repeat protein (TIGR01451 family)
MPPGGWFGFLINVRVPSTVTNNTVITNLVELSTTTQVITETSILSGTEPTTLLQTTGNPTNLTLAKRQTPGTLVAGSPGNSVITYTITVTNEGPAPAEAVNVFDLYPFAFQPLSIVASKPVTQAQCTAAAGCVLGSLAVGESAAITIVMRAGASVAAGVYTNTAFVASSSPELTDHDNSASVAATVTRQVNLQISKTASPSPTVAGQSLTYLIVVTNTGPSDASNVTISDTLPVSFTSIFVLSSQGGCAALPCNLGTLAPNSTAWIQIDGTVSPSATAGVQLANTAQVTATENPIAQRATVTPTLIGSADLAVLKLGTATAAPGETVRYTLTVTNLGPSLAQNVRVTDTLPAGVTFAGGQQRLHQRQRRHHLHAHQPGRGRVAAIHHRRDSQQYCRAGRQPGECRRRRCEHGGQQSDQQ